MNSPLVKERFRVYHIHHQHWPRKSYRYYVTGRGLFPFDMLRYDHAWPFDADAAARIDFAPAFTNPLRSVQLLSYKEPTIERWSSFGWSVGLEDL